MNSHDSAAPQFEAWESKARLTLELVVLGVFIPYLLFIAWHRLREGDLTWLLLAGAGAAYLVEIGRAVKHWIKPILVISDRTLEYRWVHFSRRKRISADEIVGLGDDRLVLLLEALPVLGPVLGRLLEQKECLVLGALIARERAAVGARLGRGARFL